MKKKRSGKLSVFFITAFLLVGVALVVNRYMNARDSGLDKKISANWHGNDFNAVDIMGERFTLSQLSGQSVVVHFWASWCGPCVNEFPQMIRFIESFNGKVRLVALSADQSDEDIKLFLKKMNVRQSPFIHIIRDDGNKIAEQYITKMLPTTIILNSDLKIEKRFPGEVEWQDPRLREIFLSMISSISKQNN